MCRHIISRTQASLGPCWPKDAYSLPSQTRPLLQSALSLSLSLPLSLSPSLSLALTLSPQLILHSLYSALLLDEVIDDFGCLLVLELGLGDATHIEQALQLRVQVIQLE